MSSPPPARAALVALLALLAMTAGQGRAQPSGRDSPVPVGPYLDGAFPAVAPGSARSWKTVPAYPAVTFTDPMWITPWPGSGDLLLVERTGRLKRFPNRPDVAPAEVEVVLDWRGRTQITGDDGGLFSAAFHPRFADAHNPQRYLFVCHTNQLTEGVNTVRGDSYWRLTRLEFDVEGGVIPGSETILISLYDPQKWHNGGAMFFGPRGFLHLSNGDGGHSGNPFQNGQVLDKSLFGVVIRIDVDMRGGSVSHPIRRQPRELRELPEGVAASYTQNYYIPSDNPWVHDPSRTGGEAPVLEEIYACGLRSPHSMQFDRETKRVWIGEVGFRDREEMNCFTLDPDQPVPPGSGPNFGWDAREGTLGEPLPAEAPGVETLPVVEYDRSVGSCVIGGGVYRGGRFAAELGGKVILGDNRTAQLWSLAFEEDQEPVLEELTMLGDEDPLRGGNVRGLTNICFDQDGEVLFLYAAGANNPAGRIYTLVRAELAPEAPALLSQTGAFTDMKSLAPAPALLPYSVNSPLWSDRAIKSRWIALPNDGTHDSPSEKIIYDRDSDWEFPAGTVLVKHFELPVDARNPVVTRRLETRFLVCLPGGRKYGVTYRWRPDHSDADLVSGREAGFFPVVHRDGSAMVQTWQFPSRSDCLSCHNASAGQALGVRSHQLNGSHYYPRTGRVAHQLKTWSALGMFDRHLPHTELTGTLRAAALDDVAFPLEHRVRSYLDTNCAHCHRPGAPGPGFDARLTTPLSAQRLVGEPLRPDIEGRFDLDPASDNDGQVIAGHPGLSAVHVRLAHVQPSPLAMPPLGNRLVDEQALEALTSWIEGLVPADHSGDSIRVLLGGPRAAVSGVFEVPVILDRAVAVLDRSALGVTNGRVLGLHGSGSYYVARIAPTGSPVSVWMEAESFAPDGVRNLPSNTLTVPFHPPAPLVLDVVHDPASGMIRFGWPSEPGFRYRLRSSRESCTPPLTWPVHDGLSDLEATPPRNLLELALPAERKRFFVIEAFSP